MSYTWLKKSLDTIHRADWYRSVQTIEGMTGAIVSLDGKPVINFASNDYLGLAEDARLIQAAIDAIREFGTGSTGSRLLSGHRQLHQDLESAIASLKQTEDALVFSSGYLANLGTITAIVGKRDLILSDQYNHSSLKNGAIMSGATVLEFPHQQIEALKNQLEIVRDRYRRCLIITDSIFSMDGDLCQLPELLDVATKFSCMLLIDEAHATGVLGKNGAGAVEHFHCTGREMIQIGTLSKAIGSLGGYVAGSAELIDYLRNRAPTWIYSTSLTPADTAAAIAGIKIIQQEPERRDRLWQNVTNLKQNLSLPTSQILPSGSPIICIQLKNAATALQVGTELKQSGIFVPAIRPPTVPTSRIRISLMTTHQPEQIQYLAQKLNMIEV